jgi:hypothetical protein
MLPRLNKLRNRGRALVPLLVSLTVPWAGTSAQEEPSPEGAVLTNIAQVRQLSAVAAARQLQVKVRGVVTAFNPSSLFVQDDTGGTFVNFKSGAPTVPPGAVIEVEGVSYAGRFVPGITLAQFEVMGHAELPAATAVGFDDLLTARWHYQRVQVHGIVRSVTAVPERERAILTVALGARRLEVQLVTSGVNDLAYLVDAQVSISGLAAGYINDRRQLITPQLLVSRLEDLRIEALPPSDPFLLPLISSSALLNFNPNGLSNHRVRVRGVVTHRQPGEAIFLRDGEYGLLVQTSQGDPVHPGAVVEAIGFPAMGRFSAFLEDAEFRIVGRESDPRPQPTTIGEALTGTNEANLITLDAQLLEVLENPAETVLVLRAENTAFHAQLPRTSLSLRKGSNVRLIGVCRVPEPTFSGISFSATPRTME